MKNFGEKLRLAELRMTTIKDKIDIFSSQVGAFFEQPLIETPLAEQLSVVSALYTAVDPEDQIDVKVATAMTSRFSGITISRQAHSLYLIQDKSVTLALEGENNEHLKVRIGSSWLDFADYMT